MLRMPINVGVPAQSYRCAIEGVTYGIRLRWMSRPGAWYMDLSDASGVPIRKGIKLVKGWPLLYRVKDDRRPTGDFYLLDKGKQNANAPTLTDFGVATRLYYFTRAELVLMAEPAAEDTAVTFAEVV